MARLARFSADQLAWTHTWHLRTETVRAANDRIVNQEIHQPLAEHCGTGTLPSSDGQRFPDIRSLTQGPTHAPLLHRHRSHDLHLELDRPIRHPSHSDHRARSHLRARRDIFDNETDLEIDEHTTDTAGYTDLVYGLFDLTGLRFSPRIRDLADQRVWRLPTTSADSPAAALLQHRIPTATPR